MDHTPRVVVRRHNVSNFMWRKEEDGRKMCVWCNIESRSRNVCTSSAIETGWHNFSPTERFYGDWMSPETAKLIKVPMLNDGQLRRILTKFGVSRQVFSELSQISLKSNQWDPCWYMRTDGQTDEETDGLTEWHDISNSRSVGLL